MLPSETLRLKVIVEAVQTGLGVLSAIKKLLSSTAEGRAARRAARLDRDIEKAPAKYQKWERKKEITPAGYDWLMAQLALRKVWEDPPTPEYLARAIRMQEEE
ncbi:hypothetical protein [Lewinella sp. JB7]|uniref:hypothetical protein n=1 Tax=Lewinella sp. JB7 TaxID=2962887 RepID=UPI0020C9CCF0|nr:hypothetical protein [Lewinella sp. JB7]MCP9237164.1 hypothetical protein [Lewinella sp. JB7]